MVTGCAGCAGMQSALDPSGRDAEQIALLTWTMTAGAVVIWIAVVAIGWYYGRPHEPAPSTRRDSALIIGGGVAIPLVVLTTLLIVGLRSLPAYVARAPEGSLTIDVMGRQWWWEVRYHPPGTEPIVTANEIRLAVDEPVQLRLMSDNVIHSFWVPSLAGKVDMIPGRTTHLRLEPTRTGTFMGVCAEYCGTAHALMRIPVVVMAPDAFEAWLASQAEPAATPTTRVAVAGRDAMLANGCGACHRIDGTAADGISGPDLTHLARRLTLGAGAEPLAGDTLRRWLADAKSIKPGVHMPAFDVLPPDELDAIAAYLEGLH